MISYEAGFKTSLLSSRVTLNTNVFLSDFDNFQNATFLGTNFLIGNAKDVSTQGIELDMVATTPSRIVQILCPELSHSEVNAIRRRIYDTVVLGFGTKSSALAASLEGGEDLPTARVGVHEREKVSLSLKFDLVDARCLS